MIKKRADGTKYYYYYKKKIGRPKKRGRKKVKKKRGRSWQQTWDFKIIKTVYNKQTEFIGRFHNAFEVNLAKEELKKINDSIVFPKTYITNFTKDSNEYNTQEVKTEYLILERIKGENDKNTTKLPNEYGKLVNHTTNSDAWKINSKMPCLEEETFWVYRHHPKTDRKTFEWVFENLIETPLLENTELMIQVFLYKNKVFMRQDGGYLEFVICKNMSDAIRMYNLISAWSKQRKLKRCFLTGQIITCSERGRRLVKELVSLTGWSEKKIRDKAT